MIEYWFSYGHLTDQPWEDVLRGFIPRMVSAGDELSCKLTILDLIACIQDTHANIAMQDSLLTDFHGARIVSTELRIVEVVKPTVSRIREGRDEVGTGLIAPTFMNTIYNSFFGLHFRKRL